jgi:hypothetical protein
MFEFLKKGPPATPAYEVANALWIHGVSDGPEVRMLAKLASEGNSLSETIVFDEAVYFMSFATDLTIHRVFKSDPRLEHALREEFLDHVRGYARYQQCMPCPVGDWLHAEGSIWEIHSPGRNTGDPALHFVDRLLLYAAAMERPWKEGRPMPLAGVLCALCNKQLSIVFNMAATRTFIHYSKSIQELLRSTRVKP